MSRVRDVPDDVRDALAAAADAEGLSMTSYVRRELRHLARRSQLVRDDAVVVRETRRRVAGPVDRATILAVLREGRDA